MRLVYDDVGCWNVKNRFFKQMETDGIQVAPFLPVRFPKFTSKVDFRNHRKIVVIDGIIGYVGGMNLAERYFYQVDRSQPVWRDTHVRIMGNAVGGLQRAFLSDWYVAAGLTITDQVYYPREEECRKIMACDREPYVSRNALIQIVTSIPTAPWPDIMQGMILALLRARQYCYLQSPYFMPTERMLFALQTAALAGVDVRLMIPERTDKRFLTWASRSFLHDVMRAGVRVYLYQKGFLHSKTLVCDDTLMSCGSTNIDFRSFERNFEVNAFVYDKEAALHMKKSVSGRPEPLQDVEPGDVGDTFHLVPCSRILYSLAVSFALKKEKFTLPYARCSLKEGCVLKSLVLPCSNTNRPSGFSRLCRNTRSGSSSNSFRA